MKNSTLKAITISAVVFLLLLIIALVINIVRLSTLNLKKAELTQKLDQIERQIQANDATIDYIGNDDYIDRYAREYLNMQGRDEQAFTGK